MGISKTQRDRLRQGLERTLDNMMRAVTREPIPAGDDGAAALADRLAKWNAGRDDAGGAAERFTDAAKVLRGGTVDYLPAPPAAAPADVQAAPAADTAAPAPVHSDDPKADVPADVAADAAKATGTAKAAAKRGGGILGRRRAKAPK